MKIGLIDVDGYPRNIFDVVFILIRIYGNK